MKDHHSPVDASKSTSIAAISVNSSFAALLNSLQTIDLDASPEMFEAARAFRADAKRLKDDFMASFNTYENRMVAAAFAKEDAKPDVDINDFDLDWCKDPSTEAAADKPSAEIDPDLELLMVPALPVQAPVQPEAAAPAPTQRRSRASGLRHNRDVEAAFQIAHGVPVKRGRSFLNDDSRIVYLAYANRETDKGEATSVTASLVQEAATAPGRKGEVAIICKDRPAVIFDADDIFACCEKYVCRAHAGGRNTLHANITVVLVGEPGKKSLQAVKVGGKVRPLKATVLNF